MTTNNQDRLEPEPGEEPNRKSPIWMTLVRYMNLILAIGTPVLAFATGDYKRLLMVPIFVMIFLTFK
mgnify:CR=1 FL=1